ncbi:MAG TPA: c-type cytochrome [Methylomirabilota bacterium]|nr:c-type cytochrome [Methylomirabilota bacterium]
MDNTRKIRLAERLVLGMLVLGGFLPPAGAATGVEQLKVAKDFKVELLYTVPKDKEGSWVAMCTDPKGRLLVSDQYGKLYRITPPPPPATTPVAVQPVPLEIGHAQGLLYAFDSLYVMVNDEKYQGRGLYRVRDTNGDDQFDEVKLLRKLEGGGEHGPHAIVLSPDGQSLYVVIGNQTKLTRIDSSRVPLHWSEDHLISRMWDGNGFMKGVLAPGGWIARTDPNGEKWELIATGFRNEYDAAFNRHGDLFTYDADMEWDLNTPWYRPTRINHVISGAEFGWRSGAGKFPAHYVDSFGAVVDIGPGSPTGVTFGYGAKFPAKYQEALFICDWSFGKLYAVHLVPSGSTYTATTEEFVTGQPLALTDLVINPQDGAMYFAVGGRRTQSALYRVTYAGNESTAPARGNARFAREREQRRRLESFHGRQDPAAIKEAWKFLDSEDRALRFAARVALEWQDPAAWRDKALTEKNPRAAIAALVALARVSSKDQFHRKEGDPKPDPALQGRMLAALDRIAWKKLSEAERLDLMRAYALTFTRLGPPDETTRQALIAKFEPLFPSSSRALNSELGQMLVFLEAPTAATRLVAALRSAPTQEEQMDYARMLRVLKTGWTQPLREEYFRWFLRAANFKGGASLAGFLRNMKADAIATLSDAEKTALKDILEAKPEKMTPLQALSGRKVVKEWSVAELAPLVERGLTTRRNFERGRKLFGEAGCASCHRFDSEGASVGPDLTNVAGRFSARDLLESIVEPNKEISDQYGAIVITKKNGDVVTGRVGNLNGDNLMVIENMYAPNDFTNVKRQDIQSIEPSKTSMMPSGLLDLLHEDEVQDLMAFLLSRGDRQARWFR